MSVQLRPPGFHYKRASSQTELYCERVRAENLVRRFGTPLYVYSSESLKGRFATWQRAFSGVPHTICYSVKANSNLAILRMLAQMDAGFDVVSGGELQRVLLADKATAAKTVFSGVGKTQDELEFAIASNIFMFNAESASELRLLANCARRMRKRVRLALRVNPDISAKTHPYISTGMREHKFGVPMRDAVSLFREATKERFLDVCGVSVHIGSQILSIKPFTAAMKRVAGLVRELRDAGIDIRYVDSGGGVGISYQGKDEFRRTAQGYAHAVAGPLAGLNVHLILEPGRSIIGPAGILLTRVLYLKQNGKKRFAVCDAAMNDLMRPALYGAYHEIVLVELSNRVRSQKIDVVGPICESGDFLARDRSLPGLHEGDLLAILDAGAYGMSLASNYNSRPRAAEVLVAGGKARVIRRRESMTDLLAPELV
jgi:diaminopimelate decarboxylase